MLPVTLLVARTFLPHFFCVVETFGPLTVVLQGKIFFRFCVQLFKALVIRAFIEKAFNYAFLHTRIIFFIVTMRASDNDAISSPSELLDVGAIVSECHGASVIGNVFTWDIRKVFKVLFGK